MDKLGYYLLKKKKERRFGVRRIREFNLSLLGKWRWRLKEEKGCLWYRVLYARYGEKRCTISEGGRVALVWWKNLINIRSGEGEGVRSWFAYNLQRRVKDSTSTLFWWGHRLDRGALKFTCLPSFLSCC